MNRWQMLAQIAAGQHGLVTVRDAVDRGIPASTFYQRAGREGWPQPRAGVWSLPGAPSTPAQSIAAAVLTCGPGAFAGRRSAAWLWGLWREAPAPIDLLVVRAKQTPQLDGIAAWRSRTVAEEHVTSRLGIPLTTVARTVADLAAVISQPALASCAIEARQQGLLQPEELVEQYARMGTAKGAGKVRALVTMFEDCMVDSWLELEIRQGLADEGFPLPHPRPLELLAPDGRIITIDIPWPEIKVGLEVDSLRWHSSHAQLTADHIKTNQFALMGWTLLRIGWWRWHHDRARFLRELRNALEAPAAGQAGQTLSGLARASS